MKHKDGWQSRHPLFDKLINEDRMEMNRRGALVLALINISLLFLLVGYPIVKEKIEEADREEIDLGQEEDSKEIGRAHV